MALGYDDNRYHHGTLQSEGTYVTIGSPYLHYL